MDNKETQQKNKLEIEMPTVNFGSTAKGQYKYEVHDKDGLVYDSGGWKPNLILDCGLDKLADMPWAQTFQWAVVGTDPTPTVEKYEDTQLDVSLYLDTEKEFENIDPDYDNLLCWQSKPPALILRAEAGCREAPGEPWYPDPENPGKLLPNVPEVAYGYKRSFGKETEIGKTLYLRDLDLQFRVLSSVPEYTVKPITIQLEAVPVSGACSSLSAIGDDGWSYGVQELLDASGATLPVSPTDQSFHPAKGMVLTTGQGYLSAGGNGCVITMGDPNIPLITANGTVNKASGISVTSPTGLAATGSCRIKGNPNHTGITNNDINIIQPGNGYGYGCGSPPNVTFSLPSSDAHRGPWVWSYESHIGALQQGGTSLSRTPSLGMQIHGRYGYVNEIPTLTRLLEQKNFEFVFGSNSISTNNADDKITLPDGNTAFIATSGYNAQNMNVMAAQILFMNDFTGSEDRPEAHNNTGAISKPHSLKKYTWHSGWHSSGGDLNKTAPSSLVTPPAANITLDKVWDDFYNTFPFPKGTVNYPANVHTVLHYYSPHGRLYNLGRGYSGSLVTTCDPDTGIYAMTHYNPGNSSNRQYGSYSQNTFYTYPEYERSNKKLDIQGKGFDKTILDQCSSAANLIDAIKNGGIGLIDPATILANLSDDLVAFQIPTKGLGSSIRNWYTNDLFYGWGDTKSQGSSTRGCIIQNGVLNNGVNSIGQGAPNTVYQLPWSSNGNYEAWYRVQNNPCMHSYIINDNDFATLKTEAAASKAWHTRGGWNDGTTWNPGPKFLGMYKTGGGAWNFSDSGVWGAYTNDDGAITWLVCNPKLAFDHFTKASYRLLTTTTVVGDGYSSQDQANLCFSSHNWNKNGDTTKTTRQVVYCHSLPTALGAIGEQNILGLPPKQAPSAVVATKNCKVSGVEFTTPGMGYKIGETPSITFSGPVKRPAKIQVTTDNITGSVSAIRVIDGGEGYACDAPAIFTFPKPPPQQVQRWNLQVKPINTYENVNQNFYHKRGGDDNPNQYGLTNIGVQALGAGGDFNSQNPASVTHKCDIYNTEQTYLGQGKSEIGLGTPHDAATYGGHSGAPMRYGPCHFVSHGASITYQKDEWDDSAGTASKLVTHNQYKTHGWYVTGISPELNSQYCGTSFLSSANQMSMVRTFDFYMELQPVTYTEIGFKEAPASRELFSRIVFDDPIRLRAGQFLRIAYQLLVTMEPGPSARYREVPSDGSWWNGERVWVNENIDQTNETNTDGVDYAVTRQKVLSGYECIQGNGMCIVDERGIAVPYDITGFANEPFAPGTYLMGPQYGYVNRWMNGDTRLSYPTREYNNDINNPWILGGDQMNPPDWGIKFFESPTLNYRPLRFKTFVEWNSGTKQAPSITASTGLAPANDSGLPPMRSVVIPAGPEMTFERDAFVHWFTPMFPQLKNSILWTNFANIGAEGKTGRWDWTHTKPYVREVYPHRMRDRSCQTKELVSDAWFNKYEKGELIARHAVGESRSGPGVWMCPVIEHDGDPGSLLDPTTVSTVRKNQLSVLGGMGVINRAQYINTNMYTGNTIYMVFPHNAPGCASRPTGHQTIQTKINCNGGLKSYTGYNSQIPNMAFDLNQTDPWIKNGMAPGGVYQYERGRELTYTNIMMSQRYMWSQSIINGYGGGWETMDSWKPWTHTPRISSAWNATNSGSYDIRPDTAGNWSHAESIPVAGSSAFISTSWDDFEQCGEWRNRSHTLYGAVCGQGSRVQHDFHRNASRELEARIANGEKIGRSPSYRIDQDVGLMERDLVGKRAGRVTEGHLSFETPTYLNDYKRLDHKRLKYAEWETSFGNLTGVRCIGLGPTSTTLHPTDMTDAARFNTYVFKFGNFKSQAAPSFVDRGEIPVGFEPGVDAYNVEEQNIAFGVEPSTPQIREGADAFNNRTTYKLKATFQFTWYRDLR